MSEQFEIIKGKWEMILEYARDNFDVMPVSYKTWLKPLELCDFIDGELIIIAPDQGFCQYIEKRYGTILKVSIEEISGISSEIRIITAEEVKNYHKAGEKKLTEEDFPQILKKANLNPRYTFDSFVVGSSNNLAHAASLAVAESPGEIYNPLYIYGGAGLGKTHLMQSIAHFILKSNPQSNIRYVTSETFINEFVDSIRNKNNLSPAEFRKNYRELDVLLIDDIQFIIGKEGTQEEFFHTFNTCLLYTSDAADD